MTDYCEVDEMIRQFQPFYDLWNIANVCYTKIPIWLSMSWEDLPAEEFNQFIVKSIDDISNVHSLASTQFPRIEQIANKLQH